MEVGYVLKCGFAFVIANNRMVAAGGEGLSNPVPKYTAPAFHQECAAGYPSFPILLALAKASVLSKSEESAGVNRCRAARITAPWGLPRWF